MSTFRDTLQQCVIESRLLYETLSGTTKQELARTLVAVKGVSEVHYMGKYDIGLFLCFVASQLLKWCVEHGVRLADNPTQLTESVDYLYQTMIVMSNEPGEECQFIDLALGEVTWNTAVTGSYSLFNPYLLQMTVSGNACKQKQQATWQFAKLLCLLMTEATVVSAGYYGRATRTRKNKGGQQPEPEPEPEPSKGKRGAVEALEAAEDELDSSMDSQGGTVPTISAKRPKTSGWSDIKASAAFGWSGVTKMVNEGATGTVKALQTPWVQNLARATLAGLGVGGVVVIGLDYAIKGARAQERQAAQANIEAARTQGRQEGLADMNAALAEEYQRGMMQGQAQCPIPPPVPDIGAIRNEEYQRGMMQGQAQCPIPPPVPDIGAIRNEEYQRGLMEGQAASEAVRIEAYQSGRIAGLEQCPIPPSASAVESSVIPGLPRNLGGWGS
jgi:hypothetical protein